MGKQEERRPRKGTQLLVGRAPLRDKEGNIISTRRGVSSGGIPTPPPGLKRVTPKSPRRQPICEDCGKVVPRNELYEEGFCSDCLDK